MGEIVKTIRIIAVLMLLLMIAVGFYAAYEKEITVIVEPPSERPSFIRLEVNGKSLLDNRFTPEGSNGTLPAETYRISIKVRGIRFDIHMWEMEADLEEKRSLYLLGGSNVRIIVDDSVDIDQY